jgi:hypothetical protein
MDGFLGIVFGLFFMAAIIWVFAPAIAGMLIEVAADIRDMWREFREKK